LFQVGAPTGRERAERRKVHVGSQGALFDVPAVVVAAKVCPVCAGVHHGECVHGDAISLFGE
jgi:hypothetical protein